MKKITILTIDALEDGTFEVEHPGFLSSELEDLDKILENYLTFFSKKLSEHLERGEN